MMRIGQIFVFYLHFSIKKNWIDYRGRLYSVKLKKNARNRITNVRIKKKCKKILFDFFQKEKYNTFKRVAD